MESSQRERQETVYRRSQRLKSVSECSTNDSGYSSEVFTSPEFSRGSLNVDVLSDSSVKSCLAFGGPATRTRLASTPHSSTSHGKAFVFPSPDLGGIKKPTLSGDSAVDIAISDTDESEIEIISRKISDNTLNIIKGQNKNESSKSRTKLSRSNYTIPRPQISPTRKSTRTNKPTNIILKLLKDAEYLLYDVLKHLSSEDLINVSQVNHQLKNIIFGHKELNYKRLFSITNNRKEYERIGKENFKLKRLNEGAGVSFAKLSPRKQLGEIQNFSLSNDRNVNDIVTSPIKSLSDRFMEEGKKLPQGEELQKCVKCKAPANVYKSMFLAVCTRKSCGFEYCTRCYLPSHRKVRECSYLKPNARSGAGIFSKKCKKNLRRL